MANITVTSVDSVITANTTTDVINVTTQTSNVIVSSTNLSDINLGNITTPIVSNANITTTATVNTNDLVVTGSVTGIDTDDVTEGSTNLYLNGSGTTSDLTEGTNLYYTNARVLAYITDNGLDFNAEKVDDRVANLLQTSGNLTFTYNDLANTLTLSQSLTTTDITEGDNLYYTNARVNAYIQSTGLTVGGDTTIQGNLEVQGNIDYVNVVDMLVNDQSITLNYGNATARDAFIYVDRSGSALNNAHLKWNETNDRWEIYDGTSTYILPRTTDDLAEGSTNLYATDSTLANYTGGFENLTGNIITSGREITLDTANATYAGTAPTSIFFGDDPYAAITAKYYAVSNPQVYFGRTQPNGIHKEHISFRDGNAFIVANAVQTQGNIFSVTVAGDTPFTVKNDGVNRVIIGEEGLNPAQTTLNFKANANITAVGNLQVNTEVAFNDVINSNIIPGGSFTLGNTSNKWNLIANSADITFLDTNQLIVNDDLIEFDNSSNPSRDAGLLVNRGANANVQFRWREVSDRWEFTNDGSNYYPLPTSTSDLTEGTNLYWTTDRGNTNSDAWLTTKTTDDLAEGNANLYYTDARARAAISSTGNINYDANTGVISESLTTTDIDEGDNLYFTTDRANSAIDDYVVGSENIDVSSGVISLANSLANVSKITSETDTALTLYGEDQVDINTKIDSTESKIINLDTTGYSLFYAEATGNLLTANVPSYLTHITATAGSNTATVTPAFGVYWGGLQTTTGYNATQFATFLGQPTFESTFNSIAGANKEGWILYLISTASTTGHLPVTAHVTGISGNTITFSENFLTNVSSGNWGAILLPAAFSSTQNIGFGISGDGTTTGIPFSGLTSRIQQYDMPETLSNVTLDIVSYSDDTFDLANSATRHMADLKVGESSAVRINRALLIGANATLDTYSSDPNGASTTESTVLGLTLENDGLTTWISDDATPQTKFLINQYTDNSPSALASVPFWASFYETGDTAGDLAQLGAPVFNFKMLNGNKGAGSNTQVTANSVVGKIAWNAISNTGSGSDLIYPPAAITVQTATDQTQSSAEAALDVYLQSTYRGSYRNGANTAIGGIPRTFLASKEGNTIIAAKTDGKIMLKPVRDYGDDANANASYVKNRYPSELHEYHTFLSAEFANTTNKSGTLVTIQDASGDTFGDTGGFNYSSLGDATLRLKTHHANSEVKTYWDITNEEFGGNLQISQDGFDRVEFASDGVYVNGNVNLNTNSAINYDAVYGCFHNDANVTAANADTVYSFEWPVTHVGTNRVTVASNTQVTIAKTGAYAFDLEMQAENTDIQDRTAYIWLAKNGTDIANTTVRVTLLKLWKQVIVKQWLVEDITANDYVEVKFAVDNTSGIQLTALPSQASPYARPAVPSAVLTVKPIGA